ncbi:PREDICTED: adhesion G protein-coupled receptor L2-like [Amphimedon queenslandica]|uniref:G-protein coupled receptors family 2 profile 2 domain-containing protein n=1 Tax=Amphimedon queenslandica TaxID=400682 RepID=A0A1X7VH67_AMPQE|nr:PREDICTED: adhesion G protein-coupled receptor L2-like [Amphimedon queenslandica]|eukprot:XP_019848861.1 PREDICTED: adhesion G protein-coupled receptor L2-like [Amphimedon queenslandica]
MAATTSVIIPPPLLSLLLLLLVNQSQLSIASRLPPCTTFRNTCSKVFQLDLSAINSTDEAVSFSISSSSLALLNISYIVNTSRGDCLTRSGECQNVSEQYYSNGVSSSQEQEVTNVYYISCTIKETEPLYSVISVKLDFGNCSYTFGLLQDGGDGGNLCPADYDNGLLWQQSWPSLLPVFKSCNDISERFSSNSYAYRNCTSNGIWTSTDISHCRLKPSYAQNAFFNIWYKFNPKEPFNKENYLISNMTIHLRSVDYSNISLQYVTRNGLLLRAGFTVILESNLSSPGERADITMLVQNLKELKILSIYETNTTQAQIFRPNTSCLCDMEYRNSLTLPVCVGDFGSPCNCSNGNCKCSSPRYVGDGYYCTVDSDRDGFPDVPLDSCIENTSKYCRKDNCPYIHNPSQTNYSCFGCAAERDRIWNLTWPDTQFGKTALQKCPNSTTGGIFFASRKCNASLGWLWPRTSNCSLSNWFYFKLFNDTNYAVNHNLTDEERVAELNYLYGELIDSYSAPPSGSNGGPTIGQPDLKKSPYSLLHINKMVDYTLKLLPSAEFDEYNSYTFIPDMVDVFDDLLNEDYAEEWKEVEETEGHHFGSTLLLENVENYFLYYTGFEKSVRIKRKNFNIMSDVYNLSSQVAEGDYVINSNLSDSYITLHIPEGLLREKTANGIEPVSIISIQFRSLDDFLSSDGNNTNDTKISSNVWSGQIGREGTVFSEPILISFTAEKIDNETHNYVCSYWNTTSGQWMTDGVYTVGYYEWTDNRSYVVCSSYHLTAFAVLVSVNGNNGGGSNEEGGTTDDSGDDDDEHGSSLTSLNHKAMSIATYAGTAASVLCLALSFLFFIAQYKDLLEKPHLFIHLNLIIALMLAYSIFGLGIELAKGNEVLCSVVAGLLHYFFLASFCWMLCEGIMLYLLLVVVFSRLAKRWYFFFAIGWVTPLIPVSITMPVHYDKYTVKDSFGNITLCWLSDESGTIWAFVAPMLLIIAINVVFFVLIVRSLCKSKRMEKSKKMKATNLRQQTVSLLKNCIILLPLMGFTWLFGLLAFDTDTYSLIFAWLFNILNSTQGVAIFFLYVVRNDKVWSKLTFCFRKYISKEVSSPSNTMMKPSLKSTRTLISNVSLSQANTFGENSSQDGNSSTSDPPADNALFTLSETDLTATHKIEDTKDNVSTASIKIDFD